MARIKSTEMFIRLVEYSCFATEEHMARPILHLTCATLLCNGIVEAHYFVYLVFARAMT